MNPSIAQIEIRIQTDPIDVAAEYAAVNLPENGARVLFTGCVRPEENGAAIDHLDYEHYAGMAEKELMKIGREAMERWGLNALRIVHRVGRIGAGEESIVIVAGSGHRAEAFDGARYVIDELKKRVPIWKSAPTTDAPTPPEPKVNSSTMQNLDQNALILIQTLNDFIGEECWSVLGSPITGTHLSLAFGEKIPRTRPTPNDKLSRDKAENKGRLGIFSSTGDWRLRRRSEILAEARNGCDLEPQEYEALDLMIGKKLVSVWVNLPSYAIALNFDSRLELQLNPGKGSEGGENSLYTLFHPQRIVSAAAGRIEVKPPSPAP